MGNTVFVKWGNGIKRGLRHKYHFFSPSNSFPTNVSTSLIELFDRFIPLILMYRYLSDAVRHTVYVRMSSSARKSTKLKYNENTVQFLIE